MGLPGSGKTTLANELAPLINAKRLNADEVRKEANDWDFSAEGRKRQSKRMAEFAKKLKDDGNYVVADFICPTPEARSLFPADYIIWVDTIKKGRFDDTNKMFHNFKSWPKDLKKNSEYIALFPNVMIGLHNDHFYAFWLEPISSKETKEHLAMYYVGEDSANGKEFESMRKENARLWKDVMLEDIKAIEGMQEGRNSPVYNGGNFSPIMDNPTHQFHKWVASNLIA